MTLRLAFVVLCFVPGALGQTAGDTQQPQGEASRSTLQVQPGPPVIKQQDIWNETGVFHPFVRMPRYMLQDQKAIWTSPIHTVERDVKYWAIFGAATAAFIATDRWTVKQLPNSSSQVSVSTWASRIGSAYTLVPITAGFYFIGSGTHEERFRETGLIGFETLIDASLVVEAVKLATDRARPLESDGKGRFLDSPNGRWSSGFPSGHAISVWALASVVAHQYPHPRIVPVLAYGLASTVVLARVGARQHFPGDVVAGSAMGWFIGDYVYGRRHNRDLDQKRSVAHKFLDQVHIGAEIQ
jgi:membrane-associated phospholipid phosphatase